MYQRLRSLAVGQMPILSVPCRLAVGPGMRRSTTATFFEQRLLQDVEISECLHEPREFYWFDCAHRVLQRGCPREAESTAHVVACYLQKQRERDQENLRNLPKLRATCALCISLLFHSSWALSFSTEGWTWRSEICATGKGRSWMQVSIGIEALGDTI